jgi:hypothetical protein
MQALTMRAEPTPEPIRYFRDTQITENEVEKRSSFSRWRDGAMARWRDGAMARWRDGAMVFGDMLSDTAANMDSFPRMLNFDATFTQFFIRLQTILANFGMSSTSFFLCEQNSIFRRGRRQSPHDRNAVRAGAAGGLSRRNSSRGIVGVSSSSSSFMTRAVAGDS